MRKLSLFIILSIGCFCILNAQTPTSNIFEPVKNNDLKEVRSLLDQKADPNSVDEDGDNPLMYAALYSSFDRMQLLIEHGSNVNAKNKLDETALMWSVHGLAKMKLLIQHGADMNVKAKSGNTALLIACIGHADDPVYQKGISFLLKTRHEDGSWKLFLLFRMDSHMKKINSSLLQELIG